MKIVPKPPPRWMAGKQPTVRSVQRVVSRSCWRLWVCFELGSGRGRREYTYYVDIYVDEFVMLRRGRTDDIAKWSDFYVTLKWSEAYKHLTISAHEDDKGDFFDYLTGHELVQQMGLVA